MNRFLIITTTALVMLACGSETNSNTDLEIDSSSVENRVVEELPTVPKDVYEDGDIRVEVFDFENFKPYLNRKDDKLHVINFWATWCIPCVAELPYFEELGAKYPDIEVTLVSLDFLKAVETNLIPFIRDNQLKSEVILLNEPDANSWIPQVDEKWSGAIPATVIYKNDNRKFYERSFTYAELEAEVKALQ